MNTHDQQADRKAILPRAKLAGHPLSQDGGVSVEEADMPLSDLSETYVADVDQEPVNHGD